MIFLKKKLYWDFIVLFIASILLYYGTSWQFSQAGVDATIYQCDATAFWQGATGLQQLPAKQCAFLHDTGMLDSIVKSMPGYHLPNFIVQIAQYQNHALAFHTLPREYPILSLFVFSPPLLAPAQFYQQAYALWSLLLLIILYAVIKHSTSRKNALFFITCTVIAGWSTAVSRFDLFPAACTLGALILANKNRWTWAYACIAVGALLKFYPILLLPVLFIAEQKSYSLQWYSWNRWKALALGFVAVFAGFILLSLAVSIPGTIGSLQYFTARPLQIESFPAALVWLTSHLGFPYHYLYAFVSINVVSQTANAIGALFTVLFLIGLLALFWLQWQGKLDTGTTCLTVLVLTLCTGKILSPQYILWIIPFVAYVREPRWQWVVFWGTVMAVTFLIYPLTYNAGFPPPKIIFPLALIRGLLLLGFVIAVLWKSIVRPATTPLTKGNYSAGNIS
jgi:Glycosyltransferase family 87